MTRRVFPMFAFALTALAVSACSTSGGSGNVRAVPVASGTTTPSPSPTPSATVSPSPSPTPSPGPSTAGVTACTAGNSSVPGNYFSIQTVGSVTGGTYLEQPGNSANAYTLLAYTASTTPAPTPTPVAIPSTQPTGAPVLVIVYYGEYNIPLVAQSGFSANSTTGCFTMLTDELVGGPAEFGAYAEGNPAFATPQPNATTALQGSITSFTITNLTPTSGSGMFTFDIGTVGTVTITGSVTETIQEAVAVSRRHVVRPRR